MKKIQQNFSSFCSNLLTAKNATIELPPSNKVAKKIIKLPDYYIKYFVK